MRVSTGTGGNDRNSYRGTTGSESRVGGEWGDNVLGKCAGSMSLCVSSATLDFFSFFSEVNSEINELFSYTTGCFVGHCHIGK